MSWLTRLFCLHRHARRERLNGVMSYVCDCGYRGPIVKRSAKEQRRAAKAGAIRLPKSEREVRETTPIDIATRRRAR